MRVSVPKAMSARAPLVGALVAVAVFARMHVAAPPEATETGVAEMLGTAIGGDVEADAFVWERSRGGWLDALWGRRILFTGRIEGQPRDLYRARVRVTREGRPVDVVLLRNLSQTPLGDESGLQARGAFAAWRTSAFDAVQGVTVYGLDGPALDGWSPLARLRLGVGQWLETGSTDGLDRREVVFRRPPSAARLAIRGDTLVLALGQEQSPAALRLGDMVLNPGPDDPYAAEAYRVPPRDKPWLHFAMDSMRAVLGTERADRIKSLLFGLRSPLLRREASGADDATERPADPPTRDGLPAARAPTSSWPPAPIPPPLAHPHDGEGTWAPPPGWGSTEETSPPPSLLRTMIRPDPALPFSEIHLVAIDTSRLQLRIEAGFDEPRPTTGPRGRGRIPRAAHPHLAAAFNGAFQSRHGAYGMAVDDRILLPPQPGAATIATDVFGDPRLGSWPDDAADDDPLPPEIVSLRQNLDPLIEDGVINPRGRAQWGFPLEGLSYLTERSALCLTRDRHLIYGWGMEVEADTLAAGLTLAGCHYAVHLDMNPGHVGFVFHGREDDGTTRAELLTDGMSIAPRRYLRASPKDFFYLVRRPLTPRAGDLPWSPMPAVRHPPPAWLPAVYRAETEVNGHDVEVFAFDPSRFSWALSPGKNERAGRAAEGRLRPEEHARALVAIGLGVGLRRGNRRGLVIDGVAALPLRPDLGLLLTRADGTLQIARTVAGLTPREDATELRLMAERGVVRPEARKLRERRRRAAACWLRHDAAFIARAVADNVVAPTEALLALGCERVVELDRGNQSDAFVHFAGTHPFPAADYDDTVLYGLAAPGQGRGRPL